MDVDIQVLFDLEKEFLMIRDEEIYIFEEILFSMPRETANIFWFLYVE